MGAVYLAYDQDLDRKLAIKLLDSILMGSTDSRQRFQQEARVLGSLSHKNIVRIYRFGFWMDEIPYIAMEFLEGPSLRQTLNKSERLPVKEALEIALQIADGLEA